MKSTTAPTQPKASRSTGNGSRQTASESELPEAVSRTEGTSASAPATDKVKEGVREMAEEAKTKIHDSADAISQVAREKLELTKAKAAEFAEASKQRAEQTYDQYVASVREKPLGAVGIAAAVGFLVGAALGSLLSRRS